MEPAKVTALIEAALSECTAIVTSERSDGRHFEAFVTSSEFVGLGLVQQHQRVYSALGDLVGGPIHALQIKTFTPDDWPY